MNQGKAFGSICGSACVREKKKSPHCVLSASPQHSACCCSSSVLQLGLQPSGTVSFNSYKCSSVVQQVPHIVSCPPPPLLLHRGVSNDQPYQLNKPHLSLRTSYFQTCHKTRSVYNPSELDMKGNCLGEDFSSTHPPLPRLSFLPSVFYSFLSAASVDLMSVPDVNTD